MARLVVKGWDSFQHYKDRAPPWIKLHKALLDNYEYQRLPLASRALAPMIWLLASESADGSMDADVDKLTFRLRQPANEIVDGLKGLIDNGFLIDASGALAGRLQDACLETEAETEEETDLPEEAKASSSSAEPTKSRPQVPCQYQAIVDAYHAALPMLPRVKVMDEKRKAAMRKRWAWVLSSTKPDGSRRATTGDEAVAWFVAFFERASANDWLTGRIPPGKGHDGWRCTLDFLMKDDGLKAVVERTEAVAA